MFHCISSPEACSPLHHVGFGPVCIGASASGIGSGKQLDEALRPPKAYERAQSFLCVYLSEAHTVDVNEREME
jgi:hypothetical protein